MSVFYAAGVTLAHAWAPAPIAALSLQPRLFQEIHPVRRMHEDLRRCAVARERKPDLGAGGAQPPHLAEEIGEVDDALAGDLDHVIALLDSGPIRGPALRQSTDDEALLHLRRVHPEPRARQSRRPSALQKVRKRRLE